MRSWYLLDPFQQPHGPLTSDETVRVLVRQGDAPVFMEGMLDWVLASELPALWERVVEALPPMPPKGRRRSAALNADGQPVNRRFNAARRADRDVQELLGLIRGIIADGVVHDSEVIALEEWLAARPDAHDVWPISVLAPRIRAILADGEVDEAERADLADLLHRATGERPDGATAMRGATRLPLTYPEPFIEYIGKTFVFTGRLAFGSRERCMGAVLREGGQVKDTLCSRTSYLVVGAIGSRDWVQSSFGRKIEDAVAMRAGGHPIAIVSEEHWSASLTDGR
jgi:hypothetical protein